ncbi:metallophosphoesterase [Actinocrispum wychmicini]|nr:metallophosphoesterase [Actinocrispum wychmicini]
MFGVPWWTVVGEPAWPTAVTVAGTVVFAAAVVGFPALMFLGHSSRGQDWAARIGDITLGVIWVLLVWSVIGQVASIVLSHEVTAVAVAAVAAGLLVWGYVEAMRVPRIKRVDVTVAGLGADLDGARLVVISDTHYGPLDRVRWSERLVAAVNRLDPDIVAHAGDIADGTPERRKEQVAPLATVQSRLARVYVTGNHEYFSEAQGWIDHMEALGWECLHNRHIVVERGTSRLVLAGVDDATARASGLDGHGADFDRALADVNAPVVLLAHQPKQVRHARDRVDLQISGHTHGGQIWPFHYLVRLDQKWVHGLSRHGARTQLYTTRGSGFWGPPFRVFAPSEITLITLRAQP